MPLRSPAAEAGKTPTCSLSTPPKRKSPLRSPAAEAGKTRRARRAGEASRAAATEPGRGGREDAPRNSGAGEGELAATEPGRGGREDRSAYSRVFAVCAPLRSPAAEAGKTERIPPHVQR